mmetsp:Transcript_23711/g.52041  ORF Transcript_23711/g.52041 Transcript_23711/m.52041 type:complete len:235 (-) Transcript_23711:644-1348(-)
MQQHRHIGVLGPPLDRLPREVCAKGLALPLGQAHSQAAQRQQQRSQQQEAALLLVGVHAVLGLLQQLPGSCHGGCTWLPVGRPQLHAGGYREHHREEGQAEQQAHRVHGGRPVEHALQLSAHALLTDLSGQGTAHLLTGCRPHQLALQLKAEPRTKSYRTQHPQGVIKERLHRRQGCPDDARPQVIKPPASQVLHTAGVDVVEHGVDGEVAAVRVLLSSTKLHLGDAAVLGIRL